MRQRLCPGRARRGSGLCHREMFGENVPRCQCKRCEEQREGLGKAQRTCKIRQFWVFLGRGRARYGSSWGAGAALGSVCPWG